MIKAFWSHFKHFERLLAENFVCSSLPATLIEVSSKPARWTYTLQPDLLRKFSQHTLLTSLGVVRGRNSPSQWVERGKRLLTNDTCQLLHIKSPRTPWIVFSLATLSFHGYNYYFFHFSQPSKIGLKNRYFVEQINWVPLSFRSK